MSIERWQTVESLFHSARTLKPEQRRGYLESACGGDQELLREVESLVANDELAAEFLETDDPDAQAGARKGSVPPGEKIGPYVILEFLKAGGMGEVHKARDTRLDRVVAIKFVPRALADDPAALSQIQREARAASALNHPRICTVHDMGEHQGRPFFVMEYLEGQSLRERLAGKAMALPELTAFAAQICDALQAAHAKGIVHRDIKPGNIFILASGQIKILDFGLAKSLSERVEPRQNAIQRAAAPSVNDSGAAELAITAPSTTAGTVAYMSPEQLRGEAVDARTDLFSFGVTLYQMATGRLPFQAETPALLREAILNRPPVPPREINPALPVELERIILMCLQKGKIPSIRFRRRPAYGSGGPSREAVASRAMGGGRGRGACGRPWLDSGRSETRLVRRGVTSGPNAAPGDRQPSRRPHHEGLLVPRRPDHGIRGLCRHPPAPDRRRPSSPYCSACRVLLPVNAFRLVPGWNQIVGERTGRTERPNGNLDSFPRRRNVAQAGGRCDGRRGPVAG
jgi:serine/threonine protein kinase